jgi:hypothetical protein
LEFSQEVMFASLLAALRDTEVSDNQTHHTWSMETAKAFVRCKQEKELCLFSALAFSLSSQALISDVLCSVATRVRNASEEQERWYAIQVGSFIAHIYRLLLHGSDQRV